MIARPLNNGHWEILDNGDLVEVWLELDGLHTKRVSKNSKGQNLHHAEMTLKYEDMVLKTEGQLKLL